MAEEVRRSQHGACGQAPTTCAPTGATPSPSHQAWGPGLPDTAASSRPDAVLAPAEDVGLRPQTRRHLGCCGSGGQALAHSPKSITIRHQVICANMPLSSTGPQMPGIVPRGPLEYPTPHGAGSQSTEARTKGEAQEVAEVTSPSPPGTWQPPESICHLNTQRVSGCEYSPAKGRGAWWA